MLKLYNSLSRNIEDFKPLNPPHVGMYTCGPTVYDYTHIGHLRTYIGNDLLRRVLELEGYEVKHVMNITDVGHLVSDEDTGEDKIEKGARESGRTVWEVAKFYEDYFWKSVQSLNIEYPSVVAKATDHIEEQIKLIHRLEKNGFIYQTDQAIYFDISKFPDYTKLSGQKLEEKEVGAREDVVIDKQKRNPQDFAVWFFTVGHFKDHVMKWPSPWGKGFPGWHIECSAMSMEYLGDTIDIHTGGVDHISVHHTNEIAQSEGATGKPFVRYWIHFEFLLVDSKKMSKSKKNFYKVEDIEAKGFDPLALRYLFLTAHYRDKLNFTWESLKGAQTALNNLREQIRGWREENSLSEQSNIVDDPFWQNFVEAARNDLNMPQAVGILWDMVHSSESNSIKAKIILEMDKILGLELDKYLGKNIEVPDEVMKLVHKRETARKSGNFKQSDKLRKEIKKMGFEIEDNPSGPKLKAVVDKGRFALDVVEEEIITIDGPTSSGKNSVGFLLAQKVGYKYIDSGMIYRAGCYKILQENIATDDLERILEIYKNLDVRFETNDHWKMFLDGEDVTDSLHTPEISKLVPIVSAYPKVREITRGIQRRLGADGKIVMGGRDIGSEIYPGAKHKFFLTASTEVRAQRRFQQLVQKNPSTKYEDVLKDMEKRDTQDMTREASPLRVPKDAVTIDNSYLTIEQTVDEMLKYVNA